MFRNFRWLMALREAWGLCHAGADKVRLPAICRKICARFCASVAQGSFYDGEQNPRRGARGAWPGVAVAASACAGGGGNGSSGGPVTLTFWTNATPGPGLTYYQNAVKTYHKLHPDVTIKIQAIQNEDLDGKLQTALNSNSAPDIFFQRGGGKMLAMVNAGEVAGAAPERGGPG